MRQYEEVKDQKGMEEAKRIKKIYSEVLKVLKKHKDDMVFSVDKLEEQANAHIFGVELKEKYGLNIDLKKIHDTNYIRVGDFRYIVSYIEAKNKLSCFHDIVREIGKFDYLFVLDFPMGAYIFSYDNKEYPANFFAAFLQELRTYNPDFVSNITDTLCWRLENSKEIFNSFEGILDKYYELNEKRIARKNVVKLEAKLKKLKSKLKS